MFQPKFDYSNKLITNITSVERLYGQIEGLKLPRKLELNLTRHNLIKSAYASNKIEGNPMTMPEVTNLILNDRVPVNRDEKEVKNYYSILENLDHYQKREFSVSLITDLHKILLTGVDKTAGSIRNIMVVVGKYREEKGNVSLRVKHDPPYHRKTEIETALNGLFSWIKKTPDLPVVIKAGLFHHHFVYLHPFEDGNGRICRILTALLFLENGYRINKYFILDDYYDVDRQQYSDMLHTADTGTATLWLEYFSDGVKYSLQSSLVKFRDAMKTLKFEEQPTPKEKEVLKFLDERKEITSHDLAAKLKVSRQQAHGLLKSLLEKGLVDKKGITKRSYYFIK